MIVKFLKNSGGGSAKATIDYLLGKERDREGARVLSGDPELTQRLSDSLNFKNRYTVGVLSFEEGNLPDDDKRAIMDRFEGSLLAGLDKDQYNITWIEHTDKDRLELNFVIANQELTTGKRLQPYYDKADRPLIENWKQVINHEYGLTDPHDPNKAQAIKTLNRQNLPKDVQQVKEQIGQALAHQIEQGNITDRKGVIDTLEQAGFEIARQTDKSISIKNPDGKRNIRLEGVIYENRQLGKELGKEHSRARQGYAETSTERYQTALGKLRTAIEVKQEQNRASFSREHQTYQREQKHHTASFDLQNLDRGIDGRINSHSLDTVNPKLMARYQLEKQQGRASRDTAEYRTDTSTSSGTGESEHRQERRWDALDRSEAEKESGSRQINEWQAFNDVGVRQNEQRLFNTLQRASRRTGSQAEQTRSTDRAIDRSQSAITDTERQITSTDREVASREQQAQQREQHAQQVIEASRQAEKVVSRGMER